MIATVSADYKALSNGKLISVTENVRNKTKTFHWMQDRPHSTYLTMLAAGTYHVIEDSLGDLKTNKELSGELVMYWLIFWIEE